MVVDLAELAGQVGLRPTRVLQARPDRVVACAQDEHDNVFALKTDKAPGAFIGDVEANRTLSTAGLPVPEIVAHQIGPPSLLVLRWIDGDPLSSAQPVQAQREAGRLLRLLHALPPGTSFSGRPTVSAWIADWTEELAGWWPSVGGSPSQVAYFRNWHDELGPILAHRPGCLTLFDGRAEHFLVQGCRVAGIIDLHDVGSGDPAMDIAVLGIGDELLIPPVLQGYGGTEQDNELGLLVPFYVLLRRLAGAEWNLRTGSETVGRHLLRLAVASMTAPSD